MREILFKAKRITDGKWVEGYYIYHIKRTICPIGDSVKPQDEQHAIMCDGFSDWNMPRDTVYYDVDPNTLCQFTGLKDKDGNKIWENDIVKCGRNMMVSWDNHFSSWCLSRKGWLHKYYFGEAQKPEECAVVGNIFDNPELLEEYK